MLESAQRDLDSARREATATPGSREGGFERYLDSLEQAFSIAADRAGGVVSRELGVARSRVRLEFAGPALTGALATPFAHLGRAETGGPLSSVRLWSAASTGVPLPQPPWRPEEVQALGEVRFKAGDRFRALCDPASGAVTVVDVERATAYFHLPQRGRLRWYHLAAPLRNALHWLLIAPRRRLLHGAAVAHGGRGAVIGGRGGSGKSTLAVACLQAGFDFLGDDYVAVSRHGSPAVHSLYATAKLDARSLRLLPGIDRHVVNPDFTEGEKAVAALGGGFWPQLCDEAPLHALILPRRMPSGETRVRRVSAAEALLALAPTTIFQLPTRERETLSELATIARSVPTYALEMGGSPQEAAAALEGLLRDGG